MMNPLLSLTILCGYLAGASFVTSFTIPSNLPQQLQSSGALASRIAHLSQQRQQHYHGAHSSSTALHGIPKMFRWLTDQYPDIINRQLEEGLSPDLEVDNFYLDMNGRFEVWLALIWGT